LGRMRPTLTSPGSMLIVKLELDTMSYELISDEASSKSKWADQWGRHTLHLRGARGGVQRRLDCHHNQTQLFSINIDLLRPRLGRPFPVTHSRCVRPGSRLHLTRRVPLSVT
jgi:hypothetical protein